MQRVDRQVSLRGVQVSQHDHIFGRLRMHHRLQRRPKDTRLRPRGWANAVRGVDVRSARAAVGGRVVRAGGEWRARKWGIRTVPSSSRAYWRAPLPAPCACSASIASRDSTAGACRRSSAAGAGRSARRRACSGRGRRAGGEGRRRSLPSHRPNAGNC
eukprot:2463626-Prymnesium_polylepis.1